ncbi:MAG: hypothetical protein IPL46_15050 [Saprospiraceae bacterium]|nr:hypothetical protein [Saprospiraceae bacterium]
MYTIRNQPLSSGTPNTFRLVSYLLVILLIPVHSRAQEENSDASLIIEMLDNFQKILPYHLAYGQQILALKNAHNLTMEPGQNWKAHLKMIQELLEVEYRIVGDQLILFPKKIPDSRVYLRRKYG